MRAGELRLVLCFVVAAVMSNTTAAVAQPRRSELSVDFPFAGTARRDLGYVATRDVLRPSFGAGLRMLGRVARDDRFELHVGARLAVTTWRTDSLRDAESAFRSNLDPGLVVRGALGSVALALTLGPTFALPAIAELFAGVRSARGGHLELSLGWGWASGRLRLGAELAYVHHRLRAGTPNALTITHLLALRLSIGVAARERAPAER